MTVIETATEIRPFNVDIPEEALAEMRRRIAATRWPTKELVDDRSQGVQLATLRELARYWEGDYDWRKAEAKLNALPQFTTEIDGVEIHFIHVRAEGENALPLIMTHGWPGSVIELLETVGPLTNPTAHGGDAEDAFDLVLPSLPGYGFSGEPAEVGWDLGRTAKAWAELMRRLGYTRYVAQGGDVGAGVTDAMARQAPDGLIGIHTNLLVPALGGTVPNDTDEERAAAAQIATFQQSGNGYFVEMATRPQTIGYALLDSPIALAAWMADHDTDAYSKIASAFVDGKPSGNLSRDHILDNIALYWLTGTGASAARSYWEADGPDAPAAGSQPLPPSPIPVGFTTFPGDIWRTPRSWVEASYPKRHLLQRSRQGRPLRGVGGAGAVQRRAPGRLQVAPLEDSSEGCARRSAARPGGSTPSRSAGRATVTQLGCELALRVRCRECGERVGRLLELVRVLDVHAQYSVGDDHP
jgi:pimeloyl-ACP methyl ester carboxylesterase